MKKIILLCSLFTIFCLSTNYASNGNEKAHAKSGELESINKDCINSSENASFLVDFTPTAGATETFVPSVGDFFFDPGGPGGGADGSAGNYPNCGCTTLTTLSGVYTIEFLDYAVNGNFDYLVIYDGIDDTAPVLFDSNANNDYTYADLLAANGGSGVFNGTSGSFHFELEASTVVNRLGWEVEILSTTPVTCTTPSDIVLDNITDATATLSWTASPDETNGYAWAAMNVDDDPAVDVPVDDGVTATGVTTASATGLSANTTYDFYVRTDCGSGDLSFWTGPLTMTTACTTIAAPWLDDVEAHSTTTSFSVSECWTATSQSTFDWNIGTGTTTSSNTGPSGANSGTNYFYVEATDGSSGDEAYLVSPIININALTDPALSFYYHMYGADMGDLYIDVHDGTSWTNGVASIIGEQQTSESDPWSQLIVNLTGYTGDIQVRFRAVKGADYESDISIDDIAINEAPSCFNPTNLTATNITATTADLGWTENGTATTWDIEWLPAGDPPTGNPSATTAGITSNPYTLSGLNGNTSYDFYVRADCGVTDGLSNWTGPFTFTTPCNPFETAPWSEDFENGGSIPNCWEQGASNSEDWKFANTPGSNHIGNNGTIVGATASGGYFAWVDNSSPFNTGTTLESPFIDVSGLSVPLLTFYRISDNEGDPGGNVEFSVDVWDGAAWNEEVYFSDTNTLDGGWEKIEVFLSSLNITGPIQLRFIIDETNGGSFDDDVAIDDVTVEEGPTCPYPTNLTATNFTATTADLGWQENGSATTWDIEWGTEGFTPSGTPNVPGVTTNPYTLPGLTELTEYDLYVRADCSGGDESTWSGPYTFKTAADCSIYTLSVTTTGGSVCDEGTASLGATASGDGDEIYWYDAATGGNIVGIGSNFDTPSISTTTSYWAAEVVNGGNLTGQAFANPTTFTNSTSNSGGLLFNVTSPIIIVDVEVFGTSATGGDITIELRDIDNGNATIASTTATITGGGTTAAPIPHTIPLDFAVPAAGNYRLVKTGASASVGMGYVTSANSSFPYPLGSSGEVTGGASATGTSTLQFYFFNWTIQEAALCESTREETIATVHEIIDIEVSSDAVPTNSIAPGGNTNLTATSTNTDYTYAWTWSGGSDTGATINVSPADDTTYTVTATDTVTGCENTAEITILVYDITQCTTLDITATTGGYICEEGTTTLTATDSGTGDDIYWYDDATDGNLVGTGSSFETPSLTTTMSYWAAEVLLEITPLSGQAFQDPLAGSTSTSTLSNYGLIFNVTSEINIVDVEVFSTTSAGGDIDIELRDINDNNATLATTTVTIPGGGTTSAPISMTVPLNFNVPPGDYRLLKTSGPGMTTVTSTNNNFPYPLGASGEITSGSTSTGTTVTYYYFYNWTIEEVLFLCESPREEAIATVVDIDEVDVSATQTSINPGGNTDLTASSTNTNYTYAWTWDGGSDTGATINVSPTDHTTYTVTATDTVTGCEATNEITILVFDTTLCNPLDITATTGDTVCIGETANLSATASGSGDDIYWYDAEFDGNLVGEGATFDTPALTSTTSYWAAEVLIDPSISTLTGQAKDVPPGTASGYGGTQLPYGVVFDATDDFTLIDVTIYPTTAAGSITIALADDTGTILETAGPIAYPAGTGTTINNGATPFTIPLDFSVTTGVDYKLYITDLTSDLVRELSGAGYPHPIGDVGNTTSGWANGSVSSGTYYFFYNWTISAPGVLCESDREEVIATVTSDDAPVGNANQDFFAGETLADLNVTGSNLIWYDDDQGTTVLPDTTPLVDDTTYYVSQTVNGCESQLLAITVTEVLPCDDPSNLTLDGNTDTTADISWTASSNETDGYNWVLMDENDDPNTDTPVDDGSVGTGVTTVALTGLDDDTTYDFYVQADCGTGLTAWIGPLTFTTDVATAGPVNDDCADAVALVVGVDFDDESVIGTNEGATNDPSDPLPTCDENNFATNGKDVWYAVVVPTSGYITVETRTNSDSNMADTGLQIYSGVCGSIASIECNADDGDGNFSKIELSGQTAGETLLVRVWGYNTNEGEFLISAYDDYDPTVFPAPYCGPIAFDSDVEPITNVDVAGISNTSSNVINGSPAHEDFTLVIGTMEQGESYSIALEGNTGGNYTNHFTVFIDWNQNDELDDTGETYQIGTIVNSTGMDGQQATGTITVPVGADLGQTRMRVFKNFDVSVTDPCAGTDFGQVEDYTIDVLPAPLVCESPSNLVLSNITETSLDISWDEPADISEVEGYGWRVMNAGDDPETDVPVVEDFVLVGTTAGMITGLTPDSPYDLYLVSICDFDTEFFSDPLIENFTTLLLPADCDMPTVLVVDEVSTTTATISWNASASETNGYEWVVMAEGDDPLTDTPVNSGDVATDVTTVIVTDLEEDTTYDFYVRTVCDDDETSDLQGPLPFTTDEIVGLNDFDVSSITFYPNPMVDVVNITAQIEIEKATIFSLTGQKLIDQKVGSTTTQIDVSDFASGPYILYVTTSTGKVGIYKLIKK